MRRAAPLLAVAAAMAGCAGTETGNAADPGVPVSVQLALTGDIARDADDRALAIEQAIGSVRRIDFELPDDTTCAALDDPRCVDGRLRIEGPWAVDLLTGRLSPDPTVRIPAGRYARIDVRFAPGDDDVSLRVEGRAPSEARFRLLGDFTEDARFEGDAAVIEGEGVVPLRLALPIDAWFADAPLARCIDDGDVPRDEDGVAQITEDLGGDCDAVVDDVRRSMKRDGRID